MEVAGIVGGPQQVALSLSPALHNAAFEALGLDWLYASFPVTDDPARKIDGLVSLGVRGLNVTMPHKVEAAKAMQELHPSAQAAGCINTVVVQDGSAVGWNTDGAGLVRFLERDAGFDLAGARVAVLGAGGAARAAVAAIDAAGAAHVRVLARDPLRAAEVASLAAGATPGPLEGASLEGMDLVVNATPLGQQGEMPPVDAETLGPHCLLVDMVYVPPVTPLMQAARDRGAEAHGGIGMLLHQACLSFEVWTGMEAPINAMSAAAVAGLSRSVT